jgi:hypothetical protein
MHLRYVLTGAITPWIDNLITYITEPLNNEDPEPHSKTYNTGVKEHQKEGKLYISYKRLYQPTMPN